MSIYGRLRKNAENFIIQDVYQNMTPEQYQQGVKIAVERTKKGLTERYTEKIKKLEQEFSRTLKDNGAFVINIISVELLYELANQMNAFNEEDEEIRNQIVDKVQEIYENTMNSIEKYSSYKNNRQASREFEKRKKKLEKYFKLKF